MKKLIISLTAFAILCPLGATICRADYADLKEDADNVANFWIGGYFNNTDNSVNPGIADKKKPALPEAAGRQGTLKASEFYSPDDSASGGILFKGSPLPNRYHLELDFYNSNDWFGDLRYSFKDYLQMRLVSRRLFHNLDNVKIYDFNPVTGSIGNDVEIHDALIDDYGLRVDIDEYRVRLKTPNFPLHLYTVGEIVKSKGHRQALFLGGSAFFVGGAGPVRVAEARAVDQEKQEIGIGTNAHLGPIELDISHQNRKFDSDVAAPTYAYNLGTTVHNVIPELEADTNTVKVHTSHTGRLFASATYSKIDKTNKTSRAEAENTLGYGEVDWLPVSYLFFSAKYRSQKNDATAPATVSLRNVVYPVLPGVESKTDTASLRMRYSLIPKTNVSFKYTNQVKKVEDQSAENWSRPPKQTRNIYEVGFSNWAIPRVRITGKYRNTNLDTDLGNEALIDPVNNDPDHRSYYNLGLTWVITPRVIAFLSGDATKDDTSHNRMSGGISNSGDGSALNQQYLASMSFSLSDKVTITPTYTYMKWEQWRDLAWETSTGAAVVDTAYWNRQRAQNFALNFMVVPTKRLSFNVSADYTDSDGHYRPSSPENVGSIIFDTKQIARISALSTEEYNVRLDSDYTLGRGWGLGLDLRYTDWRDDSSDNPSDGTFTGGLMKITKQFISH